MTETPYALLIACMDTKGQEAGYIKTCLEDAGVDVRIMDAGIMGQSPVPVSITREEVALAGGMELTRVQNLGHEGRALEVMTIGAVALARAKGDEISGLIGLGGSMGTTLGTAVMRTFPIGVPKVMISTMASRDTRAFVGTRDICLFHAVCDLAGLNRITKTVLRNGAHALAGMVQSGPLNETHHLPVAALSTLGTTETAAERLRGFLSENGFEVVTFHTVGSGGAAMDEMIKAGHVQAVLDMSLHELADHRFGGDYDAGPERGLAAARKGIPLVLVPGNIDFLVTGPVEVARKRYPGRAFHIHNAAITVVRSSREELARLAVTIADIAAAAIGPVRVVVPLNGFSAFDHPELGPMPDEGGPPAFVRVLKEALDDDIPLQLEPYHINDPEFARIMAESLMSVWRNS